jgi:predicted nucleotidyltransferase component of viral defense system
MTNLDLINKIKRLTIIALASDDNLIESIVLKGGNAIDIAYMTKNIIGRASYDLDFSIAGDFKNFEDIKKRLEDTLKKTFSEHDYVVIDFNFSKKPEIVRDNTADFWGGYKAEFKVIESEKYKRNMNDIDTQRKMAVPLKPNHSPKFEIEFSKFEYVGNKKEINVDGYCIYVYTPEMIVFEKLRAICQQLPQYKNVIKSFSPRARARDFYDIHLISNSYKINPNTPENIELIKNVFDAKKVPLTYIKDIENNKSIHSDNWQSVKDTISQLEKIEDFEFYFDYVLKMFVSITFP